jgi:hypothetical protein
VPAQTPSTRPVGAHVPGAGGLAARGLGYADAVGAEAIQISAWPTENRDHESPDPDAARLCIR